MLSYKINVFYENGKAYGNNVLKHNFFIARKFWKIKI